MTEQEWVISDVPQAMVEALKQSNTYSSLIPLQPNRDRKLRLFACACNNMMGCDEMDESELEGRNAYQIAMNFAIWTPSGHPPLLENINASKAALLRDIFGNPYRKIGIREAYQSDDGWGVTDYRMPSWLTWNDGIIRKLAQRIYDSRDFSDMPVLADALEEAGCTNEEILKHCRDMEPCWDTKCSSKRYELYAYNCYSGCKGTGWAPLRGRHARGCWVVDLLLGKE